MAEKRMFSKTVIDSDAFIDMPLSVQALYFHLSMRADDDGFVNNPKRIQRMINSNDDDLKILIAKNFIIPFESGVIVIRHWKLHNYIQNDRYKPTRYYEEFSELAQDENGVYNLDTGCIQPGYNTDTTCIQPVSKMDTQRIQPGYNTDTTCIQPVSKVYPQNSIDKISIDKNSLDKDSLDKNNMSCTHDFIPEVIPDDKSTLKETRKRSIEKIINHLNKVLGTNYKTNTKKTVSLINARFEEGFTIFDFYTVIDKMAKVWTETEMEKYLTPDTLFSTKFEKYLNRTDKTDAQLAEQAAFHKRYDALIEWASESENGGDFYDAAGNDEDTRDHLGELPDFSKI